MQRSIRVPELRQQKAAPLPWFKAMVQFVKRGEDSLQAMVAPWVVELP